MVRRSITRDRILEAALELFAEDGFAGTTISAIERRVGLAAGTGSFYRHFASKEAVLEAAVCREVEQVLARNSAERAQLPDLDDSDASLTANYTQILRDAQRFDRLMRILDNGGYRFPEVRRTISRALADASIGSWNNELQSLVAVAAISGYHLLSRLPNGPFHDISGPAFIQMLVRSSRRTEQEIDS